MNRLEKLRAIREQSQDRMDMRVRKDDNIQVVVGMATCGIAAGARPVMNTFLEELDARDIRTVTVTQCGCMGKCQLEPMVLVTLPGQETVTYVNMTPEKAVTVLERHIIGGTAVEEYAISAGE